MKQGFSLVELSIVLVILGLLVGGILAGQSLIHASQLRATQSEYQRYVTAVNAFRDKYMALPGDFSNATKFWGEAALPATCATTQGTGTQTCDGNGNGIIEHHYFAADSGGSSEQYRFWQQLASAGLVEGTYTGIPTNNAVPDSSVGGTNVPFSKFKNALWGMRYLTGNPATSFILTTNLLILGAQTTNAFPNTPVLKPEDAWNLDTKLDDGRPAFGKVLAYGKSLTCVSSETPGDAIYQLGTGDTTCTLWFKFL